MVIGFAHRGARREHRDNTLAGFARALELGASGLEGDAWVTADGVAVLDHDGVVRHRLRTRLLAAVARAELPSHIPDVADLYRLAGAAGAEISLDVKDPVAAPAVLAAAGEHRRRLWLCSGDVATLAGWRRGDADVRLVHSASARRLGVGRAEHPVHLAAAGIDALNLRAREWSSATVGACHAAGVLAFAWDVQDAALLHRLVAVGIDAVYSDDVAMMVAALGSEQLDARQRPHPQHGATDDQVAGDGPDVA